MAERQRFSIDVATNEIRDHASRAGIRTAWDRLESQEPQCGFGKLGICCRNCLMGPCRIDPFGDGAREGVCGATADTIVARNLLKHICAGTAAHSDHGREVVHALLFAADGKSEAYQIRGVSKLYAMADEFGISRDGRGDRAIAKDLARLLLAEFGRQEGELLNLARAPEQQRKNWEAAAVAPGGIDREIVAGLDATTMGVDNDAEHILMTSGSIARSWPASMPRRWASTTMPCTSS
jgi:anaerobic carbon-monoxide dehydrogenase catalytic subunit